MTILAFLLTALMPLHIQEVEVTAQQTEVNASPFRVVSTIWIDEIQSLPITTVADILRYLPGVDVRARGANGMQADVSVRGGTFDQVQIMINGVNLTDTHTGHYSMNLPISPLLIERIELIQGTSTQLFGLNAFSGAINIVTKDRHLSSDSSLVLIAQLGVGMNGYIQPEVAARVHRGEWYMNGAVEYSRSDGYFAPSPSVKEQMALDNSDYQLSNIYLQTGWRDLDIQLGAQYKDIGAGMFYGFGSQNQFDATRTGFASAEYAHRWGAWGIRTQCSYRANYDHYQWHRGEQANSNTHLTQNAAASFKAHFASRIGTTTAGVELRNEHIKSTSLVDSLYPNGCNRFNVNYCVDQTFHYNYLSANIGIGGNYNTYCGYHMIGEANIGYEYALSGKVYVNVNRSMRLPTFTDLYYNAGKQLGNKYLRPEEAWTVTVGTDYSHAFGPQMGALNVQGMVYYRYGKNIIDWLFTPGDVLRPFHASNLPLVQTVGVETELAYRMGEWLPYVGVRYAYNYVDIDLRQTGSRYLDHLRHHLVLRLNHAFAISHKHHWVLGADWTLTYQQRVGQYNDAEGNICDYLPVVLLDGAVYWRHPHVCLRMECTNMTGRHYYDYGGILQPGSWLKGVVTLRW